MQAAQTATIDFRGQPLTVITSNDQRLVAMKPICEGIGLAWNGQFERIKRDEVLHSIVRVMRTVAEDGKRREVVCLPLDYLNGWLFGIDINRCRQEIRPALTQYKRECYAALAAYWQQGEAVNPRKGNPKALPSGLTVEQQSAIKALVKARVEVLPEAKRAKAAITLWSALKSKFGCTYKKIEPALYSDAVSLVARVELEGEWLQHEEEKTQPLAINHPVDSLLVGRRIGMIQPRTANTQFLNVTLNDLREFHGSPCEQVLSTLTKAGYDVEGAWWELRTYRNKLAYLMPLIENLSAVAAEPQQYVIDKR